MSICLALWLLIAFVGFVAITGITWCLDPLVRSAGARRTWLRCLIRSSSR